MPGHADLPSPPVYGGFPPLPLTDVAKIAQALLGGLESLPYGFHHIESRIRNLI